MRLLSTLRVLTLLICCSVGLAAQTSIKPALNYLRTHYAELGLEAADVASVEVTDNYRDALGVQHVYVRQQVHGLPVLNAQAALHFRGGELIFRTSDLVTGLAAVPAPAPSLSPQTAVATAAQAVTAAFGQPTAAGRDGSELLFSWPALSPKPIRVRAGYYRLPGGQLRHVYRVGIDQHAERSDYWMVTLDANDGKVVRTDNIVLKCDFGAPNHRHVHGEDCAPGGKATPFFGQRRLQQANKTTVVEESRYNVFPFGVESPLHGERVTEVNPAHPVASPFGWHDTDGEVGAEFTITRGNNVYSYPDRDADDRPDTDIVADGGDSLVFDFFFADEVDADTLVPAALAQTFYYVNKLHDWLYVAGFDEAAGNFQQTNYTGVGDDRDHVLVEAQDGSGTNNANFGTPPDGENGVMQMFLWEEEGTDMQILTGSAAGEYATVPALFGQPIDENPIVANLSIARDASTDPELVCEAVANPEEIAGTITMITRGVCFFENKVDNAEEAGALGVIICNPGDPIAGMAESPDPDEFIVDIPSVLIPESTCAVLRNALATEDSVVVRFQNLAPPPIDGDFDNGIVAHELGHGVTNRMVGGPTNVFCLFNDEQMGEGWSDFFALAASPQTITDTPDGTEPRGIGNYAIRGRINGGGIRSQPYSRDMGVNSKTYDDVVWSGTAPHPLGEVWSATLWDLYWAMVDEYGLEEDLIDGDGGNNRAVRLVVEGLRYTACRPGLVAGRDGILAADDILYDGANQCLIWEVFARRGVGFSAVEGDTDDRTDNQEAFDVNPACNGGVQLTKTVDQSTVDAGETITYTLRATNYRAETVDTVRIEDPIPTGLTVDPGSVRGTNDFTLLDDRIVFRLKSLRADDTETIRYSVMTDGDLGSRVSFFDGAEEDDENWEILDETVLAPGENPPPFDAFWEQTDTLPFAGEFAWYVVNIAATQNQILQSAEPFVITGQRSALRFFTQYATEAGWDAGLVEISTDGATWERVADRLVRGRYRGNVAPNGLAALQGTPSFWGDSDGYREIIVDLSDYAGQEVFVRFNFYSDRAARGENGWWVDNIELIDEVVNYDPVATLTSSAGDDFSASVGELGVLVMATMVDNTVDPVLGQTKVKVYPNPATDFVTVDVSAERSGTVNVQLLGVDGRVLHTEHLLLTAGDTRTEIATDRLPAGVYVVQVVGTNRVSTTKVTVR